MHTPVTVQLQDPVNLFIYDTAGLVCLDFFLLSSICLCRNKLCVCVRLITGVHFETKDLRVCLYRNKTGSAETRWVLSCWFAVTVTIRQLVYLFAHFWRDLISFLPA